MTYEPNKTASNGKANKPKLGATTKAVGDELFADLKDQIVDIGRRIYAKGFAAGNDGNISYRLADNEVLCTPTMICKGFMKPTDLCTVDMNGEQISGTSKRTSEVRLHLAIMKARPDVKAVVHCHPPHATAFAVAREAIPQCVLPEIEVFLGDVPITVYETPGNWDFANTVLPFVQKTNIAILANHGTVSWGESVEKAYWWTEILDAYCRILMLAKDLGRVVYFSEQKERELLALKDQWGFKDPRNTPEMQNCDICANDVFRDSWKQAGVEQRAFVPPPAMRPRTETTAVSTEMRPSIATTAVSTEPSPDALIQTITDRVMQALSQSK